jgi:hypothetical protein
MPVAATGVENMGVSPTWWPSRWVKRVGRVPLEPLIHRLDRLNEAVAGLAEQVAILRENDQVQRQLITALLSSANAGEAYKLALRAVGVLNYENDVVSGERRFLTRWPNIRPLLSLMSAPILAAIPHLLVSWRQWRPFTPLNHIPLLSTNSRKSHAI